MAKTFSASMTCEGGEDVSNFNGLPRWAEVHFPPVGAFEASAGVELIGRGAVLTVEIFPRADGSTYITALSDQAPLPIGPAAVMPDPSEIDRLQIICERLSPVFRSERIIARQACIHPHRTGCR